MKSPSTHARQLMLRLREIGREFDVAEQRLRRCAAAEPESADASRALGEMQSVLSGVAGLGQELTDVRRQWESAGQGGSPEFQLELDQHSRRLERLIAVVDTCEQSWRSARDRLRPELDTGNRHRAMQRAYGAR